jgi:hypothetical protein
MGSRFAAEAKSVEPSRVPCPQCREPIAGDALVCPQCRSAALVDLVVDPVVVDPKVRYRAARALVALGPDMPTLAAAQTILGTACSSSPSASRRVSLNPQAHVSGRAGT